MRNKSRKKLIILHIDGLSDNHFQTALTRGYMPYTKKLLAKGDYQVLPYRTGLPSTTPFAQAGILYGDNHNIPSFTWYDKESGVPVRFGTRSSFKKVAHKYFRHTSPITQKGATIAACYPAGADETFALAYNEPKSTTVTHNHARGSVFVQWLRNPLRILDWLVLLVYVLTVNLLRFTKTQILRENVAVKYFIVDLLQEIFLHHMTRYATTRAMELGYPIIYAAFYAYDDAAHAFGPDNSFSYTMLRQIDRSIKYIDTKKKDCYELLLLSDHGQIPTLPFVKRKKKHLGEIIAGWYPTYDVLEIPGKHVEPKDTIQDGEIVLTYSGGIGHVYVKNIHGRGTIDHVHTRLPRIAEKLIKLPEIGALLVHKKNHDVLMTKEKTYILDALSPALRRYLTQYDDPLILFQHIKRLNTFATAGDIIFFGAFIKGLQINFENQFGGHGAYGGDQMHPFVTIKPSWNVHQKNIHSPQDIHKLIKRIQNS